jgi:glycosyltransferase involved in cell wall biosynthesis
MPCYNEQGCLKESAKRLLLKFSNLLDKKLINEKSKIIYIDDGSRDKTWELIKELSQKHVEIIGLKLSRNRGHQNALLAGLMYAKEYADVVVSMDADLQHDINAIDKMLAKFADGYEIVYGVRADRKKEPFLKRFTAQNFYRFMKLMGAELVYNSADYRLMSKRALDELAKFEESNLFLRGIVPMIGLKWTTIEYVQGERFAGESKYPFKKMLSFAWDGITSFSIKPLKLVLTIGIIIFILSLGFLAYSFIQYLLGNTVVGWTFLACSIWIVGGLEMICIGLIGEYIGKIYAESKRRPRYIIEEVVRQKED